MAACYNTLFHITKKTNGSTVNYIDTFDRKWKSFIDIRIKDNDTQNSWYIL